MIIFANADGCSFPPGPQSRQVRLCLLPTGRTVVLLAKQAESVSDWVEEWLAQHVSVKPTIAFEVRGC